MENYSANFPGLICGVYTLLNFKHPYYLFFLIIFFYTITFSSSDLGIPKKIVTFKYCYGHIIISDKFLGLPKFDCYVILDFDPYYYTPITY